MYDRISWDFVRYIWRYRRDLAPHVCILIAQHATSTRVNTFTSRRQARHLIDQLGRKQST